MGGRNNARHDGARDDVGMGAPALLFVIVVLLIVAALIN